MNFITILDDRQLFSERALFLYKTGESVLTENNKEKIAHKNAEKLLGIDPQ